MVALASVLKLKVRMPLPVLVLALAPVLVAKVVVFFFNTAVMLGVVGIVPVATL